MDRSGVSLPCSCGLHYRDNPNWCKTLGGVCKEVEQYRIALEYLRDNVHRMYDEDVSSYITNVLDNVRK